ncbi:hypothetical protein AB2B41_16270 [Marimonas sp. MJW-29]|uniref:Apea-like HEPN domain-containing protein n=1 Tax=Sulfitobacter sediminis TaxID=3234186 RepID=A0ABV3RRI0_9RHOB
MEGFDEPEDDQARSVEYSGGDLMYHQNPVGFEKESANFGTIGRTMVELSNLEWAHDKFVLTVNEKAPDFATSLSKKFPRHLKEKTDFLIHAIAHMPKLKQVPMFGDGTLNLQWLQYQLDELYQFRAALAHGSVLLTEIDDRGTVWKFDRFTRRRSNVYGEQHNSVGDGFLADVCTTADAVGHYINTLTRMLDDKESWERGYKCDLEIRQNHQKIAELVEYGIVESDPFVDALIGSAK